MTSLFTARRRAEEFAAAIDGDAAAAASRPELASLVGVVTAMRTHQTVTPRAEFTADLRARLLAEAETVLTPGNAALALPARTRTGRERRLVAAASAVVIIGGTAGMAAAAQDALPGEALYPLKRGIERAEAGLSMSQAGKGKDLLHQATDRLTEVQGLLAKDSAQSDPQVPGTLEAFSDQADEGGSLLLESFQETRDPSSVVRVRTFTADGIAQLTALAGTVPADAQDELAAAAVTLRDLDARAAALCDTCATYLPTVEVPGLLLARGEADRALGNVTPRLLDNSHPVVVPKGAVHQAREDRRNGDTATDPDTSSGSTEAGTKPAPTTVTPPGDTGSDAPAPGGIDPKDIVPTPTLPELDQNTTGGKKPVKDLTDVPGDILEDVTEDLNGTVETLLPDTDGKLLP